MGINHEASAAYWKATAERLLAENDYLRQQVGELQTEKQQFYGDLIETLRPQPVNQTVDVEPQLDDIDFTDWTDGYLPSSHLHLVPPPPDLNNVYTIGDDEPGGDDDGRLEG